MTPTHPGQSRQLLDPKALVARRNEAGLSRRTLANRVGVSQSTIRLMEHGTNHEVLTLGLVGRVCDALGIQLGAVLADEGEAQAPAPDDRLLEVALAERLGSLVHRSDLEHGLGWDRNRFTQAVNRLDDRLSGTGLALHRSGWGKYSLRARADIIPRKQREELLRLTGVNRRGMTYAEARVLRDVQAGEITEQGINNAASTRAALGSLQKQGLIEASPDGVYRPVAETAFSLSFGA